MSLITKENLYSKAYDWRKTERKCTCSDCMGVIIDRLSKKGGWLEDPRNNPSFHSIVSEV